MTPEQFKAIRVRFFANDPVLFLRELGYRGNRNTLQQRARRYENGQLEIPKHVGRFVWLIDQWRLLSAQISGSLHDLPDWPDKDISEMEDDLDFEDETP